MIIKITNCPENPTTSLRRAGYIFQRHVNNGKMSFIRPLSQSGFPRFHIYIQTNDTSLFLNLHIDQKKNTYGEATRHHGKYDGEMLQNEAKRIISIIK